MLALKADGSIDNWTVRGAYSRKPGDDVSACAYLLSVIKYPNVSEHISVVASSLYNHFQCSVVP